ncbi:MAG: dinitrogenase iron-molybdenum cofactor biosynthesis protein [Ignavibacteriaceae bacterium]|nr:dinitrogenase iron-molybdenum cofactor biosynthesis protein [Ignavibacteriaceae bacterium]
MNSLNIAVVTDDGITISQHFGRAKYYEVVFVEDGKVTKKERRNKLGHHNFAHEDHHNHHSQEGHGLDSSSHNKHVSMAEAIKDCSYVLARGMGAGAYQSMMQLNIKPIVTDIRSIDDAVQKVIDGTIIDHTEKLH